MSPLRGSLIYRHTVPTADAVGYCYAARSAGSLVLALNELTTDHRPPTTSSLYCSRPLR